MPARTNQHLSYPLTAIISDLHGNTEALDVALADTRKRGVRRYVCLGDVVGYGARPRACLDRVMRLCVPEPQPAEGEHEGDEPYEPGLCLQGNHEHALLGTAEDFNPKARAAIDWTRNELYQDPDPEKADAYWNFVGDLLPLRVDEVALFAHGSPQDPVREYLLPRDIRNAEKMGANFRVMREHGRHVCFVGHSHVPAIYYEDGSLYRPRSTEGPYDLGNLAENAAIINVGSVGQPRDGDNRLSYVLFDGQNVTFVRLEYDYESAGNGIRAIPELPDFLADRLAVGR